MRDIIMGITPYPAKERVENIVCPGTEREKINSSTTDTENVRVGNNDSTDNATQD